MAVQMTKSQLIEKIAANNELAKKDVKAVLETLATIGYKELKKTESTALLLSGAARATAAG
jgi:DNA-binding protein HU-beta